MVRFFGTVSLVQVKDSLEVVEAEANRFENNSILALPVSAVSVVLVIMVVLMHFLAMIRACRKLREENERLKVSVRSKAVD